MSFRQAHSPFSFNDSQRVTDETSEGRPIPCVLATLNNLCSTDYSNPMPDDT